MNTIYKYKLTDVGVQTITGPGLGSIIHVDEQSGHLCVWAEVNTDLPDRTKQIDVCGTGRVIPIYPGVQHVGTALIRKEGLVWHVYDLGYK
jgi:hypothetical protein